MTRHRLAACVALVLLVACNRQPPEIEVTDAPASGEAGEAAADAPPILPPAPPPQESFEPVAVSAASVRVGSAAGPSGQAVEPKPAYALGDTVHASAASAGKAGATARVYWTYQDGRSDKEEEKKVDGDVVSFSFSQADGMEPGRYTVQIDIDDVPVGLADFVVK